MWGRFLAELFAPRFRCWSRTAREAALPLTSELSSEQIGFPGSLGFPIRTRPASAEAVSLCGRAQAGARKRRRPDGAQPWLRASSRPSVLPRDRSVDGQGELFGKLGVGPSGRNAPSFHQAPEGFFSGQSEVRPVAPHRPDAVQGQPIDLDPKLAHPATPVCHGPNSDSSISLSIFRYSRRAACMTWSIAMTAP